MVTFPWPHSLAIVPRSLETRVHDEPEPPSKRYDPATCAHSTPSLYSVLVTVVVALVVSEVVAVVVCVVMSHLSLNTPFWTS